MATNPLWLYKGVIAVSAGAGACKGGYLTFSRGKFFKADTDPTKDLLEEIWDLGTEAMCRWMFVAGGVLVGGLVGVAVGMVAPVIMPLGLLSYLARADEKIQPAEQAGQEAAQAERAE